jgi:hypothetical protein
LIEAGCSCPALGVGEDDVELDPPQATKRRPTPSNSAIRFMKLPP